MAEEIYIQKTEITGGIEKTTRVKLSDIVQEFVGELGLGTPHRVINFGVDGIYSSTVTNPSWAVLAFRASVGVLADYFSSGTKLKGIVLMNTSIDANMGRVRLINETDSANMVGIHNLDVNTIVWQSENIIRYTFNGTPDLTKIKVGDNLHCDTATNATNDGDFPITTINDGADWVEVNNTGRSDGTDDEATDSPAVVEGGAIVQFANTTRQINRTPVFEVPEDSEFRIQLNRGTSAGNPSADISSAQLIIWAE